MHELNTGWGWVNIAGVAIVTAVASHSNDLWTTANNLIVLQNHHPELYVKPESTPLWISWVMGAGTFFPCFGIAFAFQKVLSLTRK